MLKACRFRKLFTSQNCVLHGAEVCFPEISFCEPQLYSLKACDMYFQQLLFFHLSLIFSLVSNQTLISTTIPVGKKSATAVFAIFWKVSFVKKQMLVQSSAFEDQLFDAWRMEPSAQSSITASLVPVTPQCFISMADWGKFENLSSSDSLRLCHKAHH